MLTNAELYQKAKDLSVEIANHESDLYLPVNDITRELIAQYKFRSNVTTFRSQIDGTMWYDIPFAYQPFWT